MNSHDSRFPLTNGFNPWLALPVIILFSAGGMILFSSIAIPLINILYGIDKEELSAIIQNTNINEKGISALFVFQALSAIGGFIAGPLLYLYAFERFVQYELLSPSNLNLPSIWLTFLIVISFMGVNSLVIQWNAQLELPEFMNHFEKWALENELQAERLTENLTTMPTAGFFMAALIVIAIIPAIGEEFLFRGLIQNKLYGGMQNIHWAIWITGFLFGAIHGQFYGLFPRMFLGVLFGYLYFWSGNLLIPILAHFINNAFTLMMIYFYREKMIGYDIEDPGNITSEAFIVSLAVAATLIWYFRYYHKKKNPPKESDEVAASR